MTTKTLNGTYSAGYTLSGSVSVLSITSTGSIGGFGLVSASLSTIVNYGAIEATAAGSTGVSLSGGGVLTNGATGLVFGGRGKAGTAGSGVAGYAGGAGVATTKSEMVTNTGALV